MDKTQIEEVIRKHKEESPSTYNEVVRLTKPFYTFHKNIFNGKCKLQEEKYNLLNSEFDVITTLIFSENKSLYAKEISDKLLFSTGGLTKVLKKLESKEYILLIEDENDKRKKLVKLTSSAEELFEKVMSDVFDFESKCFSKLNKEEQSTLEKLLNKLID